MPLYPGIGVLCALTTAIPKLMPIRCWAFTVVWEMRQITNRMLSKNGAPETFVTR